MGHTYHAAIIINILAGVLSAGQAHKRPLARCIKLTQDCALMAKQDRWRPIFQAGKHI